MNKNKDLYLVLISIIVGLAAGMVATFYRHIIVLVEKWLIFASDRIKSDSKFIFLIGILLVIFSIVCQFIKEKEGYASGSGIPQVNAEIDGKILQNPFRVLTAKISSGTLAALSGLSVGREGPSIQMGAMSAKIISNFMKGYTKEDKDILLTAGACAGLAGAFNAPIAGVMFVIEELHKDYDKRVFTSVIAATMSADLFSKLFYTKEIVFNFALENVLDFEEYYHIVIFAIMISILSIIYIYLMRYFMKLRDFISLPYKLGMLPYFILPLLFFVFAPYLLGGGGFLMEKLQLREFGISTLFIIFIAKMVYSIFSFSSGVAGGIFFPILVMGATAGQIFALVINDESIEFFMVLGMAAFLTGIVRSPLTSILLLFEMTGNLNTLLPLALVSFVTYIIMNSFGFPPIYDYLYDRLVGKDEKNIDDIKNSLKR